MKGQWIGRYEGTNNGLAVLDLDEEDYCYRGHVYAFEDNPDIPSIVAEIVTPNKQSTQSFETTQIAAIRPHTTLLMRPEDLAKDFPDVVMPPKISLELSLSESTLDVKWSTEIGTLGMAKLPAGKCDHQSNLTVLPNVYDWKSFKDYALTLPHRDFIFRGQDVCNRLRTTFHRSRRKDLIRYMVSDLPEALRALTARTKHVFDLSQPAQNGAFLNLLQHHGYPTPLLDWSYSPFVAAFFAYRHRRHRQFDDTKIRIFMFNKAAWVADFPQFQTLAFVQPHFSILEALTIENTRAIPQQALSSVTNVDDIENYITDLEQKAGKAYLHAVDLPISERRKVMEELSMMGITAGSLFPGLDGACEELRGRFFHSLTG